MYPRNISLLYVCCYSICYISGESSKGNLQYILSYFEESDFYSIQLHDGYVLKLDDTLVDI